MNFSLLIDYPFTFLGLICGLIYEAANEVPISIVTTALIPSDGLIICVTVGWCIDVLSAYFLSLSSISSLLDHSSRKKSSSHRKSTDTEFDPREKYIELLFTMFATLAKSDGLVSTAEIETVENIIKEQFAFSEPARIVAIDVFRDSKRAEIPFLDTVEKFRVHFGHDHLIIERLFEMLIRLAEADGEMKKAEEALLYEAARKLGCRLEDFDRVKDHARNAKKTFSCLNPEEEKCYNLLNCTPQSSAAEIKKAFRKLAHQYHPDKFSNSNLTEDEIIAKEKQLREILNAYDYLCTIRDIK